VQLSDFDYLLPKELVAAFPPEDRPSAKLLSVDRKTGDFTHHTFRDLLNFLKPGDLLVLNNTKVLPARLLGQKLTGGQVEAFLLREPSEGEWEALIRPGRRVKKGTRILFGDNGVRLEATVLDEARAHTGERRIRFSENSVREKLHKIGHIPLPPYLDRPDTEIDRVFYQTVFAECEGAVASPTAGLHFDEALLGRLKEKGVEIVFLTLHIGYGTFQPVTCENLTEHEMEEERFEISEEAAQKVNWARQQGRRVIACGTTSVRALESAADAQGQISATQSATRLFIYPPYTFKTVDGLITNFHLPKSTLLLLVSAFLEGTVPSGDSPRWGQVRSGRDKLFRLYEEAIQKGYRFYSYGDAMFIL